MNKNKAIFKALSMISQIGISMMVPIFMCIYIGIKLDQWLNKGFFVIIFVFVGILTAFRNIYYLTKHFYTKDKKKEDAELKYFKDMEQERNKKKENDYT